MRNNNIFKACDFYMVRNPIFSLDLFEKYCLNTNNEGKIDALIENKIFLEALAVASDNLSNTISRYKNNKNIEKKEMFFKSINKYFNRITTRPTPFGLFSSVDVNEFSNKTEVQFNNLRNAKKRARVDSDWLFEVIYKLDIEEKGYKQLKFYKNNLIIEENDKIKNLYPIKYKDDINSDYQEEFCYVKNSKSVKLLMEKAKNGCFFHEIFNVFNKVYPGIPIDIINQFLEELIKKEFIITELKNPSEKENSLKYIINILRKRKINSGILKYLIEIDNKIDSYNKLPLGEGIELLNEIKEKMKFVKESKVYLQVDLAWKKDVILNECIKDELEKRINGLINLTATNFKDDIFKNYKNLFIEKYGTEQLISVLEILDAQKGLGSPYNVDFLDNYELEDRNKKIRNYFNNKFIEAISRGEDEIVLEEDELEEFKIKELSKENVSISMETSFFINAKNLNDIDKGNFKLILGPNGGSDAAGKTFGRFLDMLDENVNEKIKKINKEESRIVGEDYEIVELNNLMQLRRLGNVCNNRHFRNYEINLNRTVDNKKNIDIEDIYVGIEKERFYLKSKKLDKKIIIKTTHMLNNAVGSIIYRFLRDISEFNKINSLSFRYLTNFDYKYIPRISYGKLIISPKTYKLKIDKFSKYDLENKKKLKEIILNYRNYFKMPRMVYLSNHDNRLLIDLNNEYQFEELYLAIKKSISKEVILEEFEGQIKDSWTNYNFEFVVPFIRNNDYFKDEKKIKDINKLFPTKSLMNNYRLIQFKGNNNRIKFPGSKWIYMKLYNNEERTDEFLGNDVYSFLNYLKNENLIEKYFYIRYADEMKHIRLRIKLKDEKYLGDIFLKLNEWFNNLYNKRLLKNVVIDSYDREIERYGGEKAIRAAEKFFEVDSINILKFKNLIENKEIDFDEFDFALCNIISIMEQIELDYYSQLEIFNSFIPREKFREKFIKNREKYIKIANSNKMWQGLRSIKDGECIYNLINELGEAAKIYFTVINQIDSLGELTNYKIEILLSLFHMHCNRLFGVNREKEEIAHSLVRHSLYSLKYNKKMEKQDE